MGILQYTSHSSLDEIAAAIQSELEQQALAAGVTIRVELKNGQGDAATINDICKMFVSDGVDLIIPIATPAATAAAARFHRTIRRERRSRVFNARNARSVSMLSGGKAGWVASYKFCRRRNWRMFRSSSCNQQSSSSNSEGVACDSK